MTQPSPRRTLLHLVACLSLSFQLALRTTWRLGGRQRSGALGLEVELDVEHAEGQIRILLGWFARARRRPRYTPTEVLLIVEHAERHQVGSAELARDFALAPATVYRWMRRRRCGEPPRADPEAPRPMPTTRICDDRRLLVAAMALAGFGGNRPIARWLRHVGEVISPRSVGRMRRDPLGGVTKAQQAEAAGAGTPPPCPDDPALLRRPRVARAIRSLRDMLVEGIAARNWQTYDEERGLHPQHEGSALLRSRRADQLDLLRARLGRIPPRHRHHYTPQERAAILEFKSRHRLSHAALAERFLVDAATLTDWSRDVDLAPPRQRPLVQPLASVAAALGAAAQMLDLVPRRLRDHVRRALELLAANVPVRRRPVAPTRKTRQRVAARAQVRRDPLNPQHPNHIWTSDLTEIDAGERFKLAAVVDLHSRDVLAWRLFATEPSGPAMAALLQDAITKHGRPRHFVTDSGSQFRSGTMQALLVEQDIACRRGAVGQHGSIAIIERLWRTTKDSLGLRVVRPQIPQTLVNRVAVVIDYYARLRPHSALGARTPRQVYLGETSRAAEAVPAPRGRRGEVRTPAPVAIRHALPAELRLPYLERIA